MGAVILVVLIALVVVISQKRSQTNAAKELDTASSVSSQNQTIDAWGEVKYDKVYDISVDFPSFVTDVKVKEGDRVSLGDTLITLDTTEYQNSCNKLQQQLPSMEADIAQTQKTFLQNHSNTIAEAKQSLNYCKAPSQSKRKWIMHKKMCKIINPYSQQVPFRKARWTNMKMF